MASLYPRNGRWHISYYLPNGRRVQKSTKIPIGQKKLAEAYLKQIEVDLARGALGWEKHEFGIMDAAEKWIDSLRARNSSHRTIERYAECLNHFIRYLKTDQADKLDLSEITPELIQDHINSRAKIRHPNTIGYELGVISSWFTFCIKMGWIEKNPCGVISKPKKVKEHIRFFSPDEILRIFKASTPQRRDLWEYLYRSCSRIGETSRLKVRDINFKRGVILYPPASTKAKRPDEVEIAAKLLPILQRLCDGKSPNDLVFSDAPEWGRRFNRLRVEFQNFLSNLDPPIKNANLHTWKHSSVAGLVMAGIPILLVKAMARHVRIETTMHYAHLAPGATKGLINKLPV